MTATSDAALDALVARVSADDADTITALRARVAELEGEYARGVNDAAAKLPELFAEWESDPVYGLDDMCRVYFPEAIRALLPAGKGVV